MISSKNLAILAAATSLVTSCGPQDLKKETAAPEIDAPKEVVVPKLNIEMPRTEVALFRQGRTDKLMNTDQLEKLISGDIASIAELRQAEGLISEFYKQHSVAKSSTSFATTKFRIIDPFYEKAKPVVETAIEEQLGQARLLLDEGAKNGKYDIAAISELFEKSRRDAKNIDYKFTEKEKVTYDSMGIITETRYAVAKLQQAKEYKDPQLKTHYNNFCLYAVGEIHTILGAGKRFPNAEPAVFLYYGDLKQRFASEIGDVAVALVNAQPSAVNDQQIPLGSDLYSVPKLANQGQSSQLYRPAIDLSRLTNYKKKIFTEIVAKLRE